MSIYIVMARSSHTDSRTIDSEYKTSQNESTSVNATKAGKPQKPGQAANKISITSDCLNTKHFHIRLWTMIFTDCELTIYR